MTRLYGFLLLLMFACCQLYAAERTEEQMKEIAADALGAKTRSAANVAELKEFISLSKLRVYGYESGGFAVVTTDDNYEGVIGVSSKTFDGPMPCGFKWWMENVNENLTSIDSPALKRGRTRGSSGMAPLLTTTWGQERPFNDNCRFSNNGQTYQCVTGCVATAMAQVMNYYRFPESGTGSYSYNITYNKSFTITFSEDFSQSFYDWDNMLDDYSAYYNSSTVDAHTQAVAKLMKDCGIAIRTSYSDSSNGSSSSLYRVDEALKTYFYYDESTKQYSRSNYSTEEWMALIYDALDNGIPIIYSGTESDSNNSSGHAFVLHGYDSTGKIYVNWGWDGRYDGYFDIDMLNPANYSYNYRQTMLIAKPGNSSSEKNTYTLDISVEGPGRVNYGSAEGVSIQSGSQSFKVKEGNKAVLYFIPNSGCQVKSVKYNNHDVTSAVADNQYSIDKISENTTVTVEFENAPIAQNSEYNLYLSCINKGMSTTIIGSNIQKKISFEIMNAGDEDIYITKLTAINPDNNSIILTSTDTNVLGTLKGNSTKSFSATVHSDATPIYELEYTLNGNQCTYIAAQYHLLSISANDYGHIVFSGIQISNETKRFSIVPDKKVTIELIPDDRCVIEKLLVDASDVTTSIVGGQYTIQRVVSNSNISATFAIDTSNMQTIDGHEYVDLGLPSGNYWSTVNYGANRPYETGAYLTSYSSVSNWGDKWIVPTKEDMQELIDKCEWTWSEMNGMKGFIVKGPNGNQMFLPAAGKKDRLFGNSGVGSIAYYITSTEEKYSSAIWMFRGTSSERKMINTIIVMEEYPLRPVSTLKAEPINKTVDFTISASGNGTIVYNEESIRNASKSFSVTEGSSAVLSLVADQGYQVGSIKINGTDVTSDIRNNEFNISRIEAATNVEVIFEEVPPKVYKLTYMIDGEEYKSYELEYGSKITVEAEPTKEGYTFSGWSELPSTMPAHDVTVTGTFTKEREYNLTYYIDGEVYKVVSYKAGETIVAEPEPVKDGYVFSGWDALPTTMPERDIEVHGSFTAVIYSIVIKAVGSGKVCYESPDGTTIRNESKSFKIQKGSNVEIYITPDTGYKLKSFSVNDFDLTSEAIVSKYNITDVKSDIDIVVEFESSPIVKHTLTYIVDGSVYKTYEFEEGARITPEAEPAKEGYTFSGWSYIPSKMPAEDVTVIGTFIQTAIEGIQAPEETTRIYDMQGNRLGKLQKGVNIIRQADGKVRKVVFK